MNEFTKQATWLNYRDSQAQFFVENTICNCHNWSWQGPEDYKMEESEYICIKIA
jgi:hypothetical protein